MSKLIKCKEHKEIFLVEDGKKCWIRNWETYVWMGFGPVVDEVDVLPFEKLKEEYPVGDTKVIETVTTIVKGANPKDIFYPEKSQVTIRKVAILGTCLPGCEEMMKELGGVHYKKMSAYGNRTGWPNYSELERLGMKVIINIRDDISEAGIIQMVQEYKDRPVCGGYWCDKLGHEPDITNPPMYDRKRFYNIVREYDPDIQNHPVMEMMDNTTKSGGYPGWKDVFSDETHDLLLFNCYPGMDKGAMVGMETMWDRFIKVFPHKHQVIPQMQAFNFQKGGIWRQYNFWKEKMSSSEFDNPYRGQISVCWYDDASIRKDEAMQIEIAEVISDAMK